MLALSRQLERFNSTVHHVVMFDEYNPDTRFQGWFYERFLGVEVIFFCSGKIWSILEGVHGLWQPVFSRLIIFNATKFCRIVNLDADTLLLQNIDHMFDEFSAPSFVPWSPFEYNLGVSLLKPSSSLFRALVEALRTMIKRNNGDVRLAQQIAITAHVNGTHIYDVANVPDLMHANGIGLQGFLNAFWSQPSIRQIYRRLGALPYGYNVRSDDLYLTGRLSYVPYFVRYRRLSEIYVVHFTVRKPWKMNTTEGSQDLENLKSRPLEASLLCIFWLSVDEMWHKLRGPQVLANLRVGAGVTEQDLARASLGNKTHFENNVTMLGRTLRRMRRTMHHLWHSANCPEVINVWGMPSGSSKDSTLPTKLRIQRAD